MLNVSRIRAITLDLDDTLWPIWPTIERAEKVLHEWLVLNAPMTAERYPTPQALREIRNAIVVGTIVVLLVFIPLFALSGIEGRLFRPLAIAYIVSILASLVVSLTVTPALCSLILPRMKRMEAEKDGPVLRFFKHAAQRAYDVTLPRPKQVLAVCGALVLLGVFLVTRLGVEFLPPFNEGSLTINLVLPPGTSLEESNRISSLAERLILEVPEVKMTGRRTGRAELDEHAEGVHSSEIEAELKESGRDREAILNDIRAKIDQLPGVGANIGQPISHRIDHLLSGVRAQVAVKIFGDDLDALRRLFRKRVG